jgi:hypothetical protein
MEGEMSYTEYFTIKNNSPYTLVLDQTGSKNIGNGVWPTTIPPYTTTPQFNQAEFADLNPTAVYAAENSSPATNIYLHFYCWSVDPLLHVNMTMTFSSGAPWAGSSIGETNSLNGEWTTVTAPAELNIDTTGNGSSRGEAVFTVGASPATPA